MRWAGAALALLICLMVCLLVVAIRVESRRLWTDVESLHREGLLLETQIEATGQAIRESRCRAWLEGRYRSLLSRG
ncbi:MAG: hypothetical protein ACE5F1_10355, partial [Planctomycetota bacterium]